MDPQQILADPNFHALPLGERLKVMRGVDPRFSALSPKDQGTVLFKSAAKFVPSQQSDGSAGPPDEGFVSTLAGDMFHMPELTDLIPGYPQAKQIVGIGKGMYDTGKKAVQAVRNGQGMQAGGYAAASMLPYVGPLAAQAGEEYGLGQGGQGTAHALEALLPFVGGDVAEAMPRGSTLKAIGKGAVKGVKEAPKLNGPLALTLDTLGNVTDHPALGAAAAAATAAPKVLGGLKGALEGFRNRNVLPPVVPPDYSVFPGMGPISDWGNYQVPQPAPPLPPRSAPAWTDFPEPTPSIPHTLDLSLPSQLPSGRKVGPAPTKPSPQPQPRNPVWQGKTTGSPSIFQTPPVSEAPTPAPTPAPQLLDLTQTPTMQNRFTPLQNMNGAAHGVAQDLDLPGSPAGKSGHAQLSLAAKKVFGVPSWAMLSEDQMSAIHNYMLTYKRLPSSPSDLLPK